MKANAPEKIYIPRLEGNETFVYEWSATKFRKYYSREIAENVEYVRADAFIEKALAFIRSCTTYDGLGYKAKCVNIDDFRKYMKGE